MVSFLFLILKPVLFLMLKKLFKKQMKVFIISAIEWLVLQTDNDLDDKILENLVLALWTRKYAPWPNPTGFRRFENTYAANWVIMCLLLKKK